MILTFELLKFDKNMNIVFFKKSQSVLKLPASLIIILIYTLQMQPEGSQQEQMRDQNSSCQSFCIEYPAQQQQYAGHTIYKNDRQNFPYRNIGVIKLLCKYGYTQYATGVLISPNLVLTAAKNCFSTSCQDKLYPAKPINFTLCLEQEVKVQVQDYRISESYLQARKKYSDKAAIQYDLQEILYEDAQISAQDQEKLDRLQQEVYQLYLDMLPYNYALLKLCEEVKSDHYPVLKPGFHDPKKQITLCGYGVVSRFKGRYRQVYDRSFMKFTSGRGECSIKTREEQIGSPVYYLQGLPGGEQSQCCIVGIHSGQNSQSRDSLCTLINQEMIKELKGWQEQWNCSIQSGEMMAQEVDQLSKSLQRQMSIRGSHVTFEVVPTEVMAVVGDDKMKVQNCRSFSTDNASDVVPEKTESVERQSEVEQSKNRIEMMTNFENNEQALQESSANIALEKLKAVNDGSLP